MVDSPWGRLEWRTAGYYQVPFPRSKLITAAIVVGTIGGIVLGHFLTKYPLVQDFSHAIVGDNYIEIPSEEVASVNLIDIDRDCKINLFEYFSSLQIKVQD